MYVVVNFTKLILLLSLLLLLFISMKLIPYYSVVSNFYEVFF